ncbi:hypothetical protein JR316_0012148 [Psilocybe cubensis]|uniref:Uncharacterized protein n=2 Tax=Psilocybe cubensis TaxID=181762 RepID=A0ACB8GH42_PSICU|nr:hypothetical protein JR316_0012148 [Psilocybe cubensis]KAH9475045.1 hypothetical protein JR316_0012148 [Psilocybe cubensis]
MALTPDSTSLYKLNQLDPGPPRRRRTKFGCKCILYVVLTFVGLWGTYASYRALQNRLALLRHPYQFLYQDPKNSYRPQDIVRPLIDRNQTFDVVATVWIRSPQTKISGVEVGYPDWMQSHQNLKLDETAIFSEKVFQGLRLQDKNKKKSVNLQVPTEIFKLRELNNYDLRASFVLIPTSPSLLDNATFYSSWIPSEAQYPPMRPWPVDTAFPSLADNIVDSYGTFTPLIAFHDIKSRCPDSFQPEDVEDDETYYEEDDIVLSFGVAENRKKWASTKGRSVLSSHPYIITRSFLRVVDMTQIFNKPAFDNAHAKLKSYSCGRLSTINGFRAWASWKDCIHSYYAIGNHAVKIRIAQISEKTGKERTEWAYAPYLSLADNAWGTKDLVPVPVNRQQCIEVDARESSESLESPTVNITWNITFSGVNLFELTAGNTMAEAMPPHNMTDAEHGLHSQHLLFEYSQGLAGHRFRDDFHPRREMALAVLNIMYWFTRSSTSGISIIGSALQIISVVLSSIATVVYKRLQEESISFSESLKYLRMVNALFTAFLILKAITRGEIRWWKKVVPIITFALATHAERTSQRIEARTSLRSIMIAYLVLSTASYVIFHQQYYLIAPRYTYGEPFKNSLCQFLFWAPNYLLHEPLGLLSLALQLILNYRMQTFAGMYKANTGVTLTAVVFELIAKAPWVIGEGSGLGPWTPFNFLLMCSMVVYAVQAWRYVSVASLEDEEDEK